MTHLRQAWLPTLLDSASSSLSSTPWSSRGDDSRTGGAPTGGRRVVPNDIDLGGGLMLVPEGVEPTPRTTRSMMVLLCLEMAGVW